MYSVSRKDGEFVDKKLTGHAPSTEGVDLPTMANYTERVHVHGPRVAGLVYHGFGRHVNGMDLIGYSNVTGKEPPCITDCPGTTSDAIYPRDEVPRDVPDPHKGLTRVSYNNRWVPADYNC